MVHSCAFPDRCFLAFWTAWKRSSRLCIWLFSLLRRASMLVGSSLGNSADCALGTRNPCHWQYTSNSHLFSYSSDHGCFAMVNSCCGGIYTQLCRFADHDVYNASYTLVRVYCNINEINFLSNPFPSIVVCVCL